MRLAGSFCWQQRHLQASETSIVWLFMRSILPTSFIWLPLFCRHLTCISYSWRPNLARHCSFRNDGRFCEVLAADMTNEHNNRPVTPTEQDEGGIEMHLITRRHRSSSKMEDGRWKMQSSLVATCMSRQSKDEKQFKCRKSLCVGVSLVKYSRRNLTK